MVWGKAGLVERYLLQPLRPWFCKWVQVYGPAVNLRVRVRLLFVFRRFNALRAALGEGERERERGRKRESLMRNDTPVD